MRTTPPLTIEVAQLPGGSGPSEDRIFVTPNAVIVLDGATQVKNLERNGGWIAQQLGQRLADELTRVPEVPLLGLLEYALTDLVVEYQLQPGESPSTTVNIVRCTEDAVDVLVLCDSPVAILRMDGGVELIRDDRIRDVLRSVPRPSGTRDMENLAWRAAVDDFEARRNKPGGFWCASAQPEAAREAQLKSFAIGDVAATVSMTDGISVGVDEYGIPSSWKNAVNLAIAAGPQALLHLVESTELSDPECSKWPRSKRHDDKAIAAMIIKSL